MESKFSDNFIAMTVRAGFAAAPEITEQDLRDTAEEQRPDIYDEWWGQETPELRASTSLEAYRAMMLERVIKQLRLIKAG